MTLDLPLLPAQIITAGAGVLRQPCKQVDITASRQKELAHFGDLLRLTMARAHGVGLAANQVGVSLRIVVLEDGAVAPIGTAPDLYTEQERYPVAFYGLVNPKLEPVEESGSSSWFEACLSVPDYTAVVPRFNAVHVSGMGLDGHKVDHVVVGWHARILQHELDHLNGILYTDRMLSRTFMRKPEYQTLWRFRTIPETLQELRAQPL